MHRGQCDYQDPEGPGSPDKFVNPGHRTCVWKHLANNAVEACEDILKLQYADLVNRVFQESPDSAKFNYRDTLDGDGTCIDALLQNGLTMSVDQVLASIPVVSEAAFVEIFKRYVPSDDKYINMAVKHGRFEIMRFIDITATPPAKASNKTLIASVTRDPIDLKTIGYLFKTRGLQPRMWHQIQELSVSSIDAIRFFESIGREYREERYILRALFLRRFENVMYLIKRGVSMHRHAARIAAEVAPDRVIEEMIRLKCFFSVDSVKGGIAKDNIKGFPALLSASTISVNEAYAYAVEKNSTSIKQYLEKRYPYLKN